MSARRSPTRTTSRPAPRSWTTADDVWGTGDLILKVKEPIAEEYHRMREGQTLFTYLHLAADRPLHRGAGRAQGHRHRLRDGRAGRSLAAAAGADVARSPAGWRRRSGAHTLMRAQGGRGVLMGGVSGVVRREGRRHRRRRRRAERRGDRAGHAGRGAAARPQHRPAAAGRRDLPGPRADGRVQRLRDRAGGARRRPGDRRGAGRRARRRPSWSPTSWSRG